MNKRTFPLGGGGDQKRKGKGVQVVTTGVLGSSACLTTHPPFLFYFFLLFYRCAFSLFLFSTFQRKAPGPLTPGSGTDRWVSPGSGELPEVTSELSGWRRSARGLKLTVVFKAQSWAAFCSFS